MILDSGARAPGFNEMTSLCFQRSTRDSVGVHVVLRDDTGASNHPGVPLCRHHEVCVLVTFVYLGLDSKETEINAKTHRFVLRSLYHSKRFVYDL